MNKFWTVRAVIIKDLIGTTVDHEWPDEARARVVAEHRAIKEPGVTFVVLEAIAAYTGQPPKPPVTCEELEKEKPF